MKCRLCDKEATPLEDRGDVSLHRCRECHFVSGSPSRDAPAAERYHDYYAGAAPPAPVSRYEEWLADAEASVGKGRLLEVGAGAGGFVRAAVARGWEANATEVSRTASPALAATGAEVFLGEVREAGFADQSFDFVVALEVLEHLDRPLEHLREWWRVLRPGGLLLLTTPNFRGLTGRVMGARWRVVAPEHVGYFTARTLAAALATAGFSAPRIRSRALDVFAWRTSPRGQATVAFQPVRAAEVRDRVNRSVVLGPAKEFAHMALGLVGLGDTLLAWARR